MEIPFAQRDLERLHVQPVARQHRRMIAPHDIGRGPSAPRLAPCRSRRRAPAWPRGSSPPPRAIRISARLPASPNSFAAQQHQNRPQPFAAAGLQILPDVGDRFHRRDRFQADLLLHLLQIGVEPDRRFPCAVSGLARACRDPWESQFTRYRVRRANSRRSKLARGRFGDRFQRSPRELRPACARSPR